MAFISIYSIAWVKLTINAACSDAATFVRPVFLLACRAKGGRGHAVLLTALRGRGSTGRGEA